MICTEKKKKNLTTVLNDISLRVYTLMFQDFVAEVLNDISLRVYNLMFQDFVAEVHPFICNFKRNVLK